MGGEDTYDCLTGLDMLVARGIADPARLGTMGISYGVHGRLAHHPGPAVRGGGGDLAVTNWYSQHRTSQIGFFDEYFQHASAYEPGGLFFARSPVMFARHVTTPTLSLAGARDEHPAIPGAGVAPVVARKRGGVRIGALSAWGPWAHDISRAHGRYHPDDRLVPEAPGAAIKYEEAIAVYSSS